MAATLTGTRTTRIHATLPIFRLDAADATVVYTPGYVAPVSRAAADALERMLDQDEGSGNRLADALRRRAIDAARAWSRLAEEPFEPECLTVYLSNRCTLACAYCFAANADGTRAVAEWRRAESDGNVTRALPLIDEGAVRAGARLVARHCAGKNRPFTLVVHGGGEPTLHWALLQRVVADTRRIADAHGTGWWGYIATNGMVTAPRARWLAATFDRIGLSCDGPPDIQDAQRPVRGGAPTSAIVQRTARTLSEAGVVVSVRATITPATVHRQSEIVAYLHAGLGARDVRFEPVYSSRGRPGGFSPDDAESFVTHFLDAQRRAGELRCALSLSGIRLDEIHGPYCNVLRQVLHLTPDGAATGCFVSTDGRGIDGDGRVVGRPDAAAGVFAIDEARVRAMRQRATAIPARCHDCVNVYHCARDCPDVCPVTEAAPALVEGGFRCRVQKRLAEAWIWQAHAACDATDVPHAMTRVG